MSFDGSRFTFDPWNDFAGVVMQQGRVQLDSDWNEWLAELGRRIRAGTLDTFGRAVVPVTTKTGFQINPAQDAAGNVTIAIGPGRMYVDGLPAENHGLPAPNPQQWIPPTGTGPVTGQLWDSALDELRGAANVPYELQPYYPNVSALAPFPQAGGPYLIYLDVWQREVTFLESPDLVEKAVGVDTTGRLQTVWQVKWLDVSSVPGVNCSTPDSLLPPTWQQLLLPPGARLTTGIVQSAQSGPCCLTPNTGYTGLENQLYRVEIHRPGIPFSGAGVPPAGAAPSGTATFKWSRDNASVATAVNVITGGTTLTVASTGKDKVLRFSPNDWVEITDDWLELNSLPGELHRVASVNDAANTITLDSAVSPSSFPVNGTGQADPARHTRLVRWDQRGKVFEADGTTVWVDLDLAGSSGDIPVPPPGTTLILENGITVTFGLDKNGGPQDTGDHWEFAARTADGTVEYLNAAPPRGIYHHYARLAVIGLSTVKLAATGTLTLQDQSQPPIPFLTFQATNTAGWPANFGVATRANALNPANFDLQVVYNPATGRGVTPPVVVEMFTNLSLDPAATNFAPNLLKSSTLISVPSFTPPSAKPVFAANFSATPTPFPASGTFQLNDTSTPPVRFLMLQVNPPAGWAPNFAVSATPAATAGNFNLEIVYVAQGGSSFATLERFTNLALNTVSSQVTSQFITGLVSPITAPASNLTFVAFSDCRTFWPPSTTQTPPALHVKAINWTNDDVMPLGVFQQGLQITLDAPPLASTVSASTMIVTLEMPQPNSPGTLISQILEFAGNPTVSTGSAVIVWKPPAGIAFPTFANAVPLRVRVKLMGHVIWARQGTTLVYLDGQAFGVRTASPSGTSATSLVLPSGNGVRASDFESWFFLVQNSPLQFTANVAAAPQIRAEGLAEVVGDITLTGTGGFPTVAGTPVPLVNITVTLNTSATSRLFGATAPFLLDAVLLIDEPGGAPTGAGKLNASTTIPAPTGVGGSGVDFKNGLAPNLIIGQITPTAPNSVTFIGVPLDAPGTGTRIFRITNLRVNAAAVSTGAAGNTPVQVAISVSGPISVPLNNPTQIVAFLSSGVSGTVVNTSPTGGLFTVDPTVGVNTALAANSAASGVINVIVQFAEGFAASFKPRIDQNTVPGSIYQAEETFDGAGIPLAPGSPALRPLMGHADQGTQLVARFQNVPANVQIFVTTRDVPPGGITAGNPDTPPALAVLRNPSKPGTTPGGVPLGTRGVTSGLTPGIPIDQVPLANGAGAVVWEWIGPPHPSLIDSLQFGVVVAMPQSTPITPPVTVSVNLSLGPISSVGAASQSEPIPRFTNIPRPSNAFTVL